MSLKKTRTMCTTCHARCGVLMYSDEDNQIVKIEGNPDCYWHVRFNSSLGLETWSLVPTHVCLMPHIIPFAFTMGQTSGGSGDVRNAKTIVLWGQNPSMERAWAKIMYAHQAEEEDFRLVVVDVRFHDMSKHADLAIQPRPGTDGALAMGVMREIIKNGWYGREWIDSWTYGFDELAERVEEWTPEHTAEVCWITPEEVREFARILGEHGPVSMAVGLGPGCMHTNAIQNGRAIACLNGLLGYIDVEGGMQFPIAIDVMLDDKITLWDPNKNPSENWTFGGDQYPLYRAFGRSNDPTTVFNAILTGGAEAGQGIRCHRQRPAPLLRERELRLRGDDVPQSRVPRLQGFLHVADYQTGRPHPAFG